MKKNRIIVIALLSLMLFGGCGNNNAQEANSGVNAAAEENAAELSETVSETVSEEPAKNSSESDETEELPDGIYTAEFTTDSSMFRINEAYENKGTLTVENGEMTIHITLISKKILNLYPGLADDAVKVGAELLTRFFISFFIKTYLLLFLETILNPYFLLLFQTIWLPFLAEIRCSFSQ